MERRAASDSFAYSLDALKEIVRDALAHAVARGATAAEAEASEATGQNVTVRRSEVETIEYNRDKGLGVTVYVGKQRGHASTSDLSGAAVRTAVQAALSIARLTASDEFAGLADPELLATEFPDLDLFHPWPIEVEEAIDLARRCEQAAFDADPRVSNSEGATVSAQQSHFAYGNTHGFLAGYPSSRHTLSCAVIAGKDDNMQRDDWYSVARAACDLEPVAQVGAKAGSRAARRLGARKIGTVQVPVLFEATVASSLLGHFVAAVSGGNLYRKQSFLLDSLGKQVFPRFVRIIDDPTVPRGLASSPFDDEGVATRLRAVVSGGSVQGYFLGTYSARKLGMKSTGNAGGNHNLIMESTGEDFPALLRKMGRGLLVTDLLGQGVNLVTGDYSRGAAGYWVENGEIAYPVQEVTVAGNLEEMFRHIVAIGTDVLVRGSRCCGSILLERMTVAGE
ncbi:MAG TPA: metalloprotease PmbA [Burkholderiales bacterium]|jgi:PmbA protein|nr:metalloprotease PmbA [Burkholderiales bacterium]